jgi:DNA primase catalytic core
MPLINTTTIEAVYAIDLETVISKVVELTKKGANLSGKCPFHEENSASFNVNLSKGIYKCFGCGKGGNNAIAFYREINKCDFPTAVIELANQHGIHIAYEEGAAAEKQAAAMQRKTELVDINSLANEFFIHQYNTHKPKIRCKASTADDWELGFAPAGFHNLEKYFLAKKDVSTLAMEVGLLKLSEKKMIYDAFRNRLMFPIKDDKNKLVAFSGRTLEPVTDKNAKYYNSTDSHAYSKSNVLFGFHRAKATIIAKTEATIVEGNWDVLLMHEKGITNTVAACGTALTKNQLSLLAKTGKAKSLLLIYDSDKAGINACNKNASLAINLGLIVDILFLPEKEDPESFFGNNGKESSFLPIGVVEYIAENRVNFILWKAIQYKNISDASLKIQAIKEICQLLARIYNPFLRDDLIEKAIDIAGVKKSTLTKAVQNYVTEYAREDAENLIHTSLQEDNYEIPKHLTNVIKWRQIRDEVLKYQYFTHDNMIYMRRGNDPYRFEAVTNFSIKIIQHMEDEKRPMRLVELTNIHNRKRTFDTSSDDFVTEIGFRKMLEGKGNYDWKGQGADFSRLCTKLKDDMGDGRMITILGWQPEGFWAYNNSMILEGVNKMYDDNGCFDYAGESFYVPSGNKIYERNDTKFFQQKRALFIPAQHTFEEVAAQMMKVHRTHAINALLYTVATAFSDLIYNRVGFFPIYFLYGEAGSGKDNLIHAIQSFFGNPQTAITITGKANTDKAKVRKFAQFTNMIGHMTEYANGDENIDQMIKSFWDRVGYERGNIDSSVGTDSIQITMSLVFTGNDYPTNDALITRFIGEEMNKTEFTEDDKTNYELLKEMTLAGYSSLLCEILKHRSSFKENFRKTFKEVGAELAPILANLNLADRMIQNAAVLGACFKLTNELLCYPFTWTDYKTNIIKVYHQQANKRSTGSIVAHFWECIIEAIKDQREPIEMYREFVIDGDAITLQFSQTYTRYLKMHYVLYKKSGLSKSVLLDKLKKSDCFIESVSSVRYNNSPGGKSSGFRFDLQRAGVQSDLIAALEIAARFRKVTSNNPSELNDYTQPKNEIMDFSDDKDKPFIKME